jgi:hypothetical protein
MFPEHFSAFHRAIYIITMRMFHYLVCFTTIPNANADKTKTPTATIDGR